MMDRTTNLNSASNSPQWVNNTVSVNNGIGGTTISAQNRTSGYVRSYVKYDEKGRPERRVNNQMIETFARNLSTINANVTLLKSHSDKVYSQEFAVKTDRILETYIKLVNIKREKGNPEDKIAKIRLILNQVSAEDVKKDVEFQKLKAKVERLKTLHSTKIHELTILKFLHGKMKHESEDRVMSHIQKYHEYYLKSFAAYKETELTSEIQYLIHLISGRESEWLRNKIASLKEFIEKPDLFIENLMDEAVRKHMSQDEKFASNILDIKTLTNKTNHHLREFMKQESIMLTNLKNEISLRILSPSEIPAKSSELRKIVSELREHDNVLNKELETNPKLKQLAVYFREMKFLLGMLSVIPGSEKYLDKSGSNALPPELRNMQTSLRSKTWKEFMKLYNTIGKKSYGKKMIDTFGDEKTYNTLLETKERSHMDAGAWAGAIAQRLKEMYSADYAKRLMINAIDETYNLMEHRNKAINNQVVRIANKLKKEFEDKIGKLGKESETAYTNLEKGIQKRMDDITKPSASQLKRILAEIRNNLEKKNEEWENLREYYTESMNQFIEFAKQFSEISAELKEKTPEPNRITGMISVLNRKKTALLGDMLKVIEYLDIQAKTPSKLDVDAISRAWSSRRYGAEKANNGIQKTITKMNEFLTGKSYNSLNMMIAASKRLIEMQSELILVLNRIGIYPNNEQPIAEQTKIKDNGAYAHA